MSAERLITIAQASRASGVAEWTLRRLVRSGQIPSFVIGSKTRRVRLSDVLSAIRESAATV
ncbi:MAG: helix-turn-helix transcriptional regulator [Isosphaeraceae bacterium]